MFYSHQLLARKAPLGQIWMAATMHAKINRRKLDKLDIIKICEQILNPAVPMALRLSGILMGGVVIVYERKVKILYDDVSRLLVEINEAWKIKPNVDPTILPKGKSQAKFEAVTLPANADMDTEQPRSDGSVTTAKFQRMRLDDVDDFYIRINPGDQDDASKQFHQADAANITLNDDWTFGFAETDITNRFERFDLDGDEDAEMNFTQQENVQEPTTTIILSPPRQDQQPHAPVDPPAFTPPREARPQDDVFMAQKIEEDEQQAKDDVKMRTPMKRKSRRGLAKVIFDDDQVMISGSVYQSWLQDPSNIISMRGRKNKSAGLSLSTKLSILMDLPPVALINGLKEFPARVFYPAPLMDLWRKDVWTNAARNSPSSGGISPQAAPVNPTRHSPPEELFTDNIPEFAPEDFQSQVGSQRVVSIEKRREMENMDFTVRNEAFSSTDRATSPAIAVNSGQSFTSSGSGRAFPMESEVLPSSRSKRKQLSSTRGSLGNLDPVAEDIPLELNDGGLKLQKVYGDFHGIDQEQLMETGPTQTPHRSVLNPPIDKVTQSIRTYFKQHFDLPGAPKSESLEQLAFGMTRHKAAQLFYQTCVLATHDFVQVKQAEAYGDILIFKGPKL